MTTHTIQPDKYSAAAWQIGAAIVSILVAAVFWFGVAYSTVTAVTWLLSIGGCVAPGAKHLVRSGLRLVAGS